MKKIICRKTAAFIFAILGIEMLHAQNPEPFSYNAEISPSVETYTITKYGNVTPSLFTGAMSYSLPLYIYRDEDFEIPLSLEYRFDGYRPDVHSGTIGYGWALQYGGIITREVKGFPDDLSGSDCEDRFEGYYKTITDGILTHPEKRYQLASGTIAGAGFCGELADMRSRINVFADAPAYIDSWKQNTKEYDTNPDIFHFNFPGCSGSFMLRPDASVEVFNCSCPKGEISVEYDFTKRGLLPESEITITDGKGYCYTFGGNYTAMEYSISSSDSYASVAAWRLRRIEAPNGNILEFVHDPLLASDLRIVRAYTPKIESELSEEFYGYETPREISSTVNSLYPLPASMKVNDKTIYEFNVSQHNWDENAPKCFSDQDALVIPTSFNTCFSSFPRKIESIIIRNYDGEQIDRINLNHSFKTSNASRMLLSSVDSNGGTHSFEYENITPPYNDTKGTDHWGFWNGKSGLINLPSIVNASFSSLYSQLTPDNESKEPDIFYSMQGALKKIIYPTGGHTTVSYEANRAGKLIDREHWSMLFIRDNSNPNVVNIGGVRVKKISNTTDGLTTNISYEYNIAKGNGTSSGLLVKMPRYALNYHYNLRVANIASQELRMNAIAYTDECGSNLPNAPFITYSCVQENFPDGSYIEYSFDGYDNLDEWYNPSLSGCTYHDKTFDYEQDAIYCDEDDSSYPDRIKRSLLPMLNDYSNCCSKMLSKSEYDSAGALRKKTSYTYGAELECERHMFYNTIVDFTEMPLRIYSPRLSEIEEELYEGNRKMVSTIHYFYNPDGQICRVDNDSDSVSLKTYYRYLKETDSDLNIPSLRSAIADVVQTISLLGNTYILSNTHYQYDDNGNTKPIRIIRHEGDAPAICNDISNTFDIPDSFRIINHFFSYDENNFRLKELSSTGGRWIKYVWDHAFRHILSKTVDSDENKYQYDWKDLVGPIKIIMPTAQIRTYEYDSRNRLSAEKDTDGAYIQKYNYHLNNE